MSERDFAFRYAVAEPVLTAARGARVSVFTEDAFCGKITATHRQAARGGALPARQSACRADRGRGRAQGRHRRHSSRFAHARPGLGRRDRLAEFRRAFGHAQQSEPAAGAGGTRVDLARRPRGRDCVTTTTASGAALRAPLKPFHGCIGVAPPHGETRLSVVPDAFGGNLDIADLGAGATLYLRANVDGGARLYRRRPLCAGRRRDSPEPRSKAPCRPNSRSRLVPPSDDIEWPRIETDREIGVVGCARPLEDAVRIAAHGLVRWIASLTGLSLAHAHQLVSQNVRLRIGNLVNPLYTVAAFVPKEPLSASIFENVHRRLRSI